MENELITEDRLLKSGFKIVEVANYVTIDFTVYQRGRFKIDDGNNIEWDDDRIVLGYRLEYMDQLRSIYAALSGEQL